MLLSVMTAATRRWLPAGMAVMKATESFSSWVSLRWKKFRSLSFMYFSKMPAFTFLPGLKLITFAMDEQIREIFYSEDYESFYSMLNVRQQEKYDYVEHIIKTQRIVNSKFIKKIEGSEFYEARISVGSDEYRTIVFAINASNFVDCSQVLFLNSFLKKDKKQYKKEVRKAEKLIEKYLED